MPNLDSIDAIRKLDQEDILGNTQDFPLQIEDCWKEWQRIAIPVHYINSKAILILGMGGSGIGAALIASIAEKISKIPVTVLKDYDIPDWVDRNTLVIGVSYSGNTEETLESFYQASQRTDKMITISTGGKLESLGTQSKAIHFKINYSSQPRAAFGYSFTSLLAIFSKLHFIEITDDEIKESISLLKGLLKRIDVDIPTAQNNAKLLAHRIQGKIPVIIGSGTLAEVARRWKGHINENAKNAAYFEVLPEMNHNALVGLEFPKDLSQKLIFIVLQSKYDHPRNKLRQNIVVQIMQQRKIECETVLMQPPGNFLAEMLQTILLGDFVAYYLAILNNVAPEPVKIINFLKDKLNEAPFERS